MGASGMGALASIAFRAVSVAVCPDADRRWIGGRLASRKDLFEAPFFPSPQRPIMSLMSVSASVFAGVFGVFHSRSPAARRRFLKAGFLQRELCVQTLCQRTGNGV